MQYNNPSEIVKDLTFGDAANEKIMSGVEKLTNAVKSTLGASGKCVIYEDAMGRARRDKAPPNPHYAKNGPPQVFSDCGRCGSYLVDYMCSRRISH